jgi:hypothetical protein
MTMRASKLIPLLLALAIPAAVTGVGCGSSSPTNNGGGTGGDEDTGGKPATGGKSGTGGKTGTGGAMGGSGGDTGGAGGSTGGSGGSTGGAGGGDTGGAGGSTGGAGGSTGGSGGATGGAGGASGAIACGMGKKAPTGAVIDNFDGQKQVLEWLQADAMHTAGMKITPMGSMKVTVTGNETLAAGALATWAMANRPCMDGSMYTGIQFNASGTVTNLLFRIGTPATYPVAEGGTCTSPTACEYAHYQKNVTAMLGTAVIKVPFAELTAPFGTPAPFDKSALISLVFLTTDTNTAHSFTIDNISFY